MVKRISIIAVIICLAFSQSADARAMKPGEFLVLCYHAVQASPAPGDDYSISQNMFAEQIEYLRTHGYHPVSFNDILKAREGKKELPGKPVLLTFDDAYISYYEFVAPFLEKLNYPSVLSVIANYIDDPPEKGFPEPLMNWEQIRELSSRKLVEIASHTYDLHKGIQYNPHGNVAPATGVPAYDPETRTYETEGEYLKRLKADFITGKEVFMKELGYVPRIIVWPYGVHNSVAMKAAGNTGFEYTFTTKDGYANINGLSKIRRNVIVSGLIEDFIKLVKNSPEAGQGMIRAVQVDLDLIYDPESDEQTAKNLDGLIDRLYEMKINTVFLQAFADPEGTGNIKSVYFHNRVLPVRADIFSHAAHQMSIRDMAVYAWMPTLSIELPEKRLNESLKVRAMIDGRLGRSTSLYRRLSPFDKDVVTLVNTLYEDLAAHSRIRGVLFQDDAYLADTEDFHPSAVVRYKEYFGRDLISEDFGGDPGLMKKWARYKTEALIDFTGGLKQAVRKYRPDALFARNLYARVLEEPGSERRFAQDYELFLENYDRVVVMAYPQMEKVRHPSDWLIDLVGRSKGFSGGIEKTVFKVQAYDWRKEVWINDRVLLEELRDVLSSGGRHIAYYPDNFQANKPALNVMKLEMSTRDFPFIP